VWPEFGQAGKQQMPVRHLLTHEAGLPVIDEELPEHAVLDWDHMIGVLERQTPVWEPGSTQGDHAVTFGWLVGEVVRRIAGTDTFGEALRRLVTEPLGLDFHVGLVDSEHHRVARLVRDATGLVGVGRTEGIEPEARPAFARGNEVLQRLIEAYTSPDSLAMRSLGLASAPHARSNNSTAWRRAQVPAANGHGNARALARVYGALARGGEIDGLRIISDTGVERAAREQVAGPDAVLVMPTRRSLGFMLPVPGQPDQRGPHSFGHAGAGGSIGYADPERGLGFGYAMNRMWPGGFMSPDPRAQSLVAAVHQSLDG
jgi:CubicO group peptidase (beta-lactamase class C family)